MSRRHKSKGDSNQQSVAAPQFLLKRFKPRTKNQYDYVRAIVESDITFCTGPAGCGKTACAVGLAAEYLAKSKVAKVIWCRPIVEASYKSIGALPGGIREKTDPYMIPLYQEFEGYLGKQKLESLIRNETIIICPLEFMRGRTFDNSIIILDEAQNATFSQITLFYSRLGKASKAVINGDEEQSDLPQRFQGALSKYMSLVETFHIEGATTAYLDSSDIQRNPTIGRMLQHVKGIRDDLSNSTGY